MADGLPRGQASSSRPRNGKGRTTRRDDRRRSSRRPGRDPRAQQGAGREHGRRRGPAPLLQGGRRRPTGTVDADMGLSRVDEFWLAPRSRPSWRPRAMLLSNLFPRQPARPLRRARRPIGRPLGPPSSGASRGRLVLNADDPLVADLGPRGRANPLFFRPSRTTSIALTGPAATPQRPPSNCRRCGRAPTSTTRWLMGHLGHYHCPPTGDSKAPGVRRSAPTGRRSSSACRRRAAFNPARSDRRGRTSELASARPLQTSTTRSPPPPLWHRAPGVPGAGDRRRAGRGHAPPSGRAEQVDLGRAGPMTLLLVKKPGRGPTRVPCGTLSLRGAASSTCSACSTTARPTGADRLVGCVGRRLRGHRAEARAPGWTCFGPRGAAELAVRFKYAGVDPARIAVVDGAARGDRDRARADGRPASLYALPTYTAMLELRQVLHGTWRLA